MASDNHEDEFASIQSVISLVACFRPTTFPNGALTTSLRWCHASKPRSTTRRCTAFFGTRDIWCRCADGLCCVASSEGGRQAGSSCETRVNF
eukprot:1446308-Rhodomonas_salina.2